MFPVSFLRRLCWLVGLYDGSVYVGGCGCVDVRTGSEAGSGGAVQGRSGTWVWGVDGILGLLMGSFVGLRGLLVEPLGIGRSMVR